MWILVVFGLLIVKLNNKSDKNTLFLYVNFDKDLRFNDIMNMNYSKFARVFDGEVWSTKVTTEDDFDKALKVTQIMNKLCYIEICTGAMDMPQLTRDVITSFKGEGDASVKSIPETYCDSRITAEKHDDNINFETHVHKSLKELGG